MEAYTYLSKVYDVFMDDVPYDKWCELIVAMLDKYGKKEDISDEKLKQEKNTILDLGCGTGTLTQLLAKRGYDMIGIDNSEQMLQEAVEKKAASGLDILYLLQDMREFELYGTAGAAICMCDSLNYILNEEEILTIFRLINNYLYPDGLFIFDFNTVYKYKNVIGEATIAENREESSFIWENYYHEDEEINEYDLTLFVKNDSSGGNNFSKYEETHYQRGYRLGQIKALLEKAGMEFVTAFDLDNNKEVTEKSGRICVVAREKGKRKCENENVKTEM